MTTESEFIKTFSNEEENILDDDFDDQNDEFVIYQE